MSLYSIETQPRQFLYCTSHSFAYITDRFYFDLFKKLRGTRREIHHRASKVSLECRNFALSNDIQFMAKKVI